MSDFLNLLDSAHEHLDAADPATIIIDGVTPFDGCACTLWPIDGIISDSAAMNFRPVSSRVSIRRALISEIPEIGSTASVGGRVFIISSIKTDSVAIELDLEDVRSL